jgi:hypothetical protein
MSATPTVVIITIPASAPNRAVDPWIERCAEFLLWIIFYVLSA